MPAPLFDNSCAAAGQHDPPYFMSLFRSLAASLVLPLIAVFLPLSRSLSWSTAFPLLPCLLTLENRRLLFAVKEWLQP